MEEEAKYTAEELAMKRFEEAQAAADEDEEKVNLDDGPTEAEEDAMEAEADEAADLLDQLTGNFDDDEEAEEAMEEEIDPELVAKME
jgi:hypothetical protein